MFLKIALYLNVKENCLRCVNQTNTATLTDSLEKKIIFFHWKKLHCYN